MATKARLDKQALKNEKFELLRQYHNLKQAQVYAIEDNQAESEGYQARAKLMADIEERVSAIRKVIGND